MSTFPDLICQVQVLQDKSRGEWSDLRDQGIEGSCLAHKQLALVSA